MVLGFRVGAKGLGPGLDNYFAMKIIDVTFVEIATCNAINNLIFQDVIFMQLDKPVIIRWRETFTSFASTKVKLFLENI